MVQYCRACLAVFLLALLGCVEERPKVSGTVTYAGEPVQRGVLTFQPLERYGVPTQTRVTAGQFAVPVPPGKYRVQVMALPEETGPKGYEERERQQKKQALWMRELSKVSGHKEAFRAKLSELQELDGGIPDFAPGNNEIHEIATPDQGLAIVVERYPKK